MSDPNTERGQPTPGTPLAHRMNQRGEDARARAAEGMTEGDGATVDTPTRSPAEVLGDGVTGAIVVLSKGEHDLELPAVDDLTIIGACPGETTLALANRGPLVTYRCAFDRR